MRVVAIIQARMGSTRLPGKVLKRVLGKPLLEYQLERVRRSKTIDEIIVATTSNENDDPIADLCKRLSIKVYRGSEDDVLARYFKAATVYHADIIVRLTSDCPLIDPEVIDQVVTFYLKNTDKFDYVSNTLKRTYPRGLDTEVLPYRVLKEADHLADKKPYREHVTLYVYRHPEIYRLGNYSNSIDKSHYRWTVDTEEDFLLIKELLERIPQNGDHFSWKKIMEAFEKSPELNRINNNVKQKRV